VVGVFYFWGNELSSLYLTGEGDPADIAATLTYARKYLLIMFIGLLPYGLTQCYSSTLRETGQATVPMIAGTSAVLVNLVLNYILIYGKFGAPALGVNGAAIATVISRFIELSIVAVWTQIHSEQNRFIIGAFRSLYIPRLMIGQILVKGLPLLANEALYGVGVATLNQCYSTLGYDVVSANNICQTFFGVFAVSFMAVGSSIAIIQGQHLGAGRMKEAKEDSRRLIAFSFFVCAIISVVFFISASFIPSFYNTTDSVKHIAMRLMQVCALTLPLEALAHAFYFTLRSGGKILITFLFDSGFLWIISIPCAFILCHYTGLSVITVYTIGQLLNLIKAVGGSILVEKGIWLQNIVE
jgi:putative MATE family efflux protein